MRPYSSYIQISILFYKSDLKLSESIADFMVILNIAVYGSGIKQCYDID